MKAEEYLLEANIKLIALHYFDRAIKYMDKISISKYGLKKDNHGAYYLPQYNTSGQKFNRIYTELMRLNDNIPPRTIKVGE
jgi:hypothetical protein